MEWGNLATVLHVSLTRFISEIVLRGTSGTRRIARRGSCPDAGQIA